MKKVNLFKALKHRKRLATELVALHNILQRENSRLVGSPSKVNREDLYGKIMAKHDELVRVKTVITTANVGMAILLAQKAEEISKLTFIKSLETKDGEITERGGLYNDRKPFTQHFTAFITEERKDTLKREIQDTIDSIQDRIDEYNASTSVTLDI